MGEVIQFPVPEEENWLIQEFRRARARLESLPAHARSTWYQNNREKILEVYPDEQQ